MRWQRFLPAMVMVLIPTLVRGEEPRLGVEGLAPVREATWELARELEYLQEDIITELGDQKERTLYRQADAALGALESFQKSLKPEMSAEALFGEFDPLDKKVHDLLKAVQGVAKENRLLQKAVTRVDAADELLHAALSGPSVAETRIPAVVERRARALAAASRQLERTAEYALGETQGRGVLIGNLKKLSAATEAFQKWAATGADKEQLREAFAPANEAWELALRGLILLKPEETLHLLRTADRVDRLHEQLFKTLGVKGERPRLTIRT